MKKVSPLVANMAKTLGYDVNDPFQEEVNEWLRNIYNCFVVISPEAYTKGINWNVQVLFYDNTCIDCWSDISSGMYGDNGEFKSYEDALEFGLNQALLRISKSKLNIQN